MDQYGILACISNENNQILIYSNDDIGNIRKVAKILATLEEVDLTNYSYNLEPDEVEKISIALGVIYDEHGIQWWIDDDQGTIPELESFTIVRMEEVK